MEVTYPGPHRATRVHGKEVERGGFVDVPEELGRQLVAQGWGESFPKTVATVEPEGFGEAREPEPDEVSDQGEEE